MDRDLLFSLVNSTHESIFTTDSSGTILFCNKSAGSLLHSSPEDLLKKSFFDLLAPTNQHEIKSIIERLPNDGDRRISSVIHFKDTSDNAPLKVELMKQTFCDREHILYTITPQTAEKSKERELYKLLAENAYDINILFEGENLVYISPSVKDLLGYKVDQFQSTHDWYGLFHEDDLSEYQRQIECDRQRKKPTSHYIYRQKHQDGTYRWFETKIRRELVKGGQIIEKATSADITQRKMMERELEMQKEFIEVLFDEDPNLVFVRNSQGHMIYCNKAVSDLAGKSREDFLSQGYNMFPASKEQESKYLEMESKVINHGEEILIEEQISDTEGVVHHFQTIKKPLRTKDEDVVMLSISTNINKIKYYEKETQNVMKARNEFFSAMSHEIRTPMNAILGMTELLLKRKPRKDQSKLLQTLHFSSKNLLSLINDILDFSKIEAGKIEIEEVNFNVRELIEFVMLSLRPRALEKDLALSYSLADRVPEVINGDYVKLNQVLNNLISNAIKFTDKGKVGISVDIHKENKEGYSIKFEVRDTGIGIAKEKLKNIFQPFHQANKSTTRVYGGTGLGLSIVQNLVSAQKGKISVRSKENAGSVFTVILPFKYADKSMPVNSLPNLAISDFKWKMNLNIMYVEDVATNQFLIEEVLGDWGVKVDMASNGMEALKKIESKAYDLILMDIQMPGIDGLETTRRIRAMEDPYFRNVPIIALTASTTEATKDEVFMSGMQDFVLKPVNVEDLRAKIVQYTNLVDEFSELNIVDLQEKENDQDSKIMFERTDKLFLENFVRYKEFLNLTIEEFKVNRDLLKDTIYNEELVKYRHLRHRMKSLIATFGMGELTKLMDEIKAKMKDGPLSEKQKKEYVTSLDYHINFLLDSMSNKLASLKWG
jgi:PAS domain S-box-containing protein